MLKISVEQVKVVGRGFFTYWAPAELTIPTYFCMETGYNSSEERKYSLRNYSLDETVVITNPKVSEH